MMMNSWKHWAVGGVAALAMMTGSVWAVDSASASAPQQEAVEDLRGRPGRDAIPPRAEKDGMGPGEHQEFLSDALGIDAEALADAQEAARARAKEEGLDQLVEDGRITQEQADAFREKDFDGGRFHGRLPMTGSYEEYLAEELGISVEDLQAAHENAIQSGLEQAVADGTITQEQADEMLAMRALKGYLAAELEGSLNTAVAQALADGAITQEQADKILERADGFLGRDGFGFPGRPPKGMHGGFPDAQPGWRGVPEPDAQSYDLPQTNPGSLL